MISLTNVDNKNNNVNNQRVMLRKQRDNLYNKVEM